MEDLKFVSASEGVASLESAISQAYFPYEIFDVGRNDCTFAFSHSSLGPIAMTRAYLNTPLRGRRRMQHGACRSDIYTLQLIEDEGHMTLNQGGRSAVTGVHELILTHAGRPLELEQHSDVFKSSAVSIPARLLDSHFMNVEQWCMSPRSAQSGSAALLREFLLSIWRERDHLRNTQVNDLVGSLLHLVGATFRDCEELPEFDSRSTQKHFLRVRDVVAANLTDPDLSADFVTDRLGISRSYLFTIMRAAGTTLGRHIIEARLERARELLASPSARNQSITDLAFSLGFQELSHFSRRFTERFGMSPRVYRAQMVG